MNVIFKKTPLSFKFNAQVIKSIIILYTITIYSYALSKAIINVSPIPQIIFGHDYIGLLDGLLKVISGQTQNKDFFVIFGPALLGTLRFGYKLSGNDLLLATPASSLFIGTISSFFAFVFLMRILPFYRALIFAFFVFIVIQSPFQMYQPETHYTYATVYNRWGTALICVLFGVFIPGQKNIQGRFINLYFAAMVASWLLLLKITYGINAIGAVMVMLIFIYRDQTIKQKIIQLLFFAIATVICFFALGLIYNLDLNSYFGDIIVAAKAKTSAHSPSFMYSLSLIIKRNFIDVGIYLFGMVILTSLMSGEKDKNENIIKGLVILFSSLFSDFTNAPDFTFGQRETPILAAGLMLLYFNYKQTGIAFNKTINPAQPAKRIALLLSVFAIALPIFSKSLNFYLSIKDKTLISDDSLVYDQRFRSGYLDGLTIIKHGGDPPLTMTYVEKTYEGVALLNKNGLGNIPVLVFDFSNSLNLARGIVSPRGSPPFFQFGFSFNEAVAPDEKKLFNEAGALMIAKHFGDGHPFSASSLILHYQNYISNCYKFIDESSEWILLSKVCEIQ